jgi:hypothetical protein
MQHRYRAPILLTAVLLVLGSAPAPAQTAPAPAETAAPAAAGSHAPALDLGLDDLMTLLVQPRHLKLYYAGAQKNWELAAAESRALRAAFTRIERSIPRYLNNDVEQTVTALFAPTVQALDAAIAAADARRFATAYKGLTDACNACHVFMEHPFIVIGVPASAAKSIYPDQDFRPAP